MQSLLFLYMFVAATLKSDKNAIVFIYIFIYSSSVVSNLCFKNSFYMFYFYLELKWVTWKYEMDYQETSGSYVDNSCSRLFTHAKIIYSLWSKAVGLFHRNNVFPEVLFAHSENFESRQIPFTYFNQIYTSLCHTYI